LSFGWRHGLPAEWKLPAGNNSPKFQQTPLQAYRRESLCSTIKDREYASLTSGNICRCGTYQRIRAAINVDVADDAEAFRLKGQDCRATASDTTKPLHHLDPDQF
jgi:hypothetical protein